MQSKQFQESVRLSKAHQLSQPKSLEPPIAPEAPLDKVLTVTCEQSKAVLRLNVSHIERALNVLLRLAPMELRSPMEFLDQMYEVKRSLKLAVEAEAEAELEKLEGQLQKQETVGLDEKN